MTPATDTPAIETQALSKQYRGRAVVDGLNLTVRRGEVFGFLGPNGAGKSTTVKMLLGLVRPSGGRLRVLGGSVHDPATRRRVGFLPEQFRFQTWMTGREFLTFHGRLSGLTARDVQARIPEVLHLVGLEGRGGENLSGYSKGMLQRVGLAQAILHRPELVFLDEPTSALDPIGRVEVREIIEGLRREGVAVFLNSHLLSEVEAVSDRVAFVNRGKVLRAGTLDELLGGADTYTVRADPATPALRMALGALGAVTEGTGGGLTLRLHPGREVAQVAPAVLGAGAHLLELTPHRPDLETLFLQLIEGENA